MEHITPEIKLFLTFYFLPRDIATAIRDLLDAVNEVFKKCQNVGKVAQYKEVQ